VIFPKMEREQGLALPLQHMWEQYIAVNPDGYRTSQFHYHYNIWGQTRLIGHMNHGLVMECNLCWKDTLNY
jgi:hypothetical protein